MFFNCFVAGEALVLDDDGLESDSVGVSVEFRNGRELRNPTTVYLPTAHLDPL